MKYVHRRDHKANRLQSNQYNPNFGQKTRQEKMDTHVNRMPHNTLPRLIKNYTLKGRRNQDT
jgi:hypothetical protein